MIVVSGHIIWLNNHSLQLILALAFTHAFRANGLVITEYWRERCDSLVCTLLMSLSLFYRWNWEVLCQLSLSIKWIQCIICAFILLHLVYLIFYFQVRRLHCTRTMIQDALVIRFSEVRWQQISGALCHLLVSRSLWQIRILLRRLLKRFELIHMRLWREIGISQFIGFHKMLGVLCVKRCHEWIVNPLVCLLSASPLHLLNQNWL